MMGKQSETEAGVPDGFHDIGAEARREKGRERGREGPFGSLIEGVGSC